MSVEVEYRTVKSVRRGEDWDEVTFEDGWCMGLPATAQVRPDVGMVIEMHMDGNRRMGYAINGMLCEDPDPILYAAKNRLQTLKWEVERIEDFIANRDERQAAVEVLPPPLRARIERFRSEDPAFHWESEPYEMAAVSEAARLLERFGEDVDALEAWSKLDYGQQKVQHPELDEGHSGNSFGAAVALARTVMVGGSV